jgi:hypothetical protein
VTEPSTKRTGRRWWKYLLFVAAAGILAALSLLLYVNTDSFQSLVRRRLIAELERVTGGRVEVGSIHTAPFRLQADVRDITVHGLESASEVPLAHADRVVARLKFSSLLRSEFGFHDVVLEQPIVHVAFYPNGTNNLPARRATPDGGKTLVEQLFALSINHLELRHGRILWDDQVIPVDFATRDISLEMNYSFLHRRYDGRLLLGMVDTKLEDCRPFAWMTELQFNLASDSAVVSSLKWNSGHSHFSASGKITDFRSPHLQGSTTARSTSLKPRPSPAAANFAPACSNSRERAIGRSISSPPTVCSPSAISLGMPTKSLSRRRLLAPATRSLTSNSNSPGCKERSSGAASPEMAN